MQTLFRELKFAIRHLRRSPIFTFTAISMLALGIGATIAIFSIVEGVLLRPLPFPQPDQLVVFTEPHIDQPDSEDDGKITGPDILAYLHGTHSFESLGGYKLASFELSGEGDPQQVDAGRLGAGIFPALRVPPLLGRTFTQQEDDTLQPVAVLSYALWQSRFHGDAHVLGGKILLDRKPYCVIGVMPPGFEFPLTPGRLNHSELWVPLSLTEAETSGSSAQAFFDFWMVGRLKPGVSIGQAREDAQHVLEQTMRGYPAFMRSIRIRAVIRSLKDVTVSQAKPLVCTLFLAVAIVLLIAAANLAGLLLVRAVRRRHEIAVRIALGARLITLAWQSVLESLILSISGGVLGLLLADILLHVGVSLLPETLPRIDEISLDWKVVSFAVLLIFLTGLVCGLAPTFVALRTNVNEALKDGGRTTHGNGHTRLRSALVIAEIAIAHVLIISAGLFLRSFEKMREVDPGFHPNHIITAAYSLPRQQYATQNSVDVFNRELLQRLQNLPEVRSAGLTSVLPQAGVDRTIEAYQVEGYTPPKGYGFHYASVPVVAGNYFQALGVPLLRGRFFTAADNARSMPVAIVNRKVAEIYWPGQSPIGKHVRWGLPETPTPWLTIVGEVADVKQGSPDIETSAEQIYQPLHQGAISYGSYASSLHFEGDSGYIVLRSALRPEEAENRLRETFRSIDKQLPLSQMRTMKYALYQSEAPRRFNTAVISAFAVAAALLAALGIYSVTAFSTALRAQEMAIRIALGSPPSGILRIILASGVRLAAAGCAIGLIGAFAASRLLRSFLFNVSPFDLPALFLSAIVILLLALAASLVPAYYASSIDPAEALRSE